MEDDSLTADPGIDPTDLDALAGGDPDIRALLDFAPVPRKTKRSDGWPPVIQRAFIAALARMGNYNRAAQAVGRSGGGAESLRKALDAEEFGEAWQKAMAIYHARNLQRVRIVEPPAPPQRAPMPARFDFPAAAATSTRAPAAPEPDEDALWKEVCDTIFMKYLLKLDAERTARLAGRSVEADLYVRQLTWLEVSLDLGGLGERAIHMFKALERGGRHVGEITATPISLVLDQLRRSYWERLGGPERPPLAPLGRHDDEAATGRPPECEHWPERDGDIFGPRTQREEHLRRNAEAQRGWEEKAKAEATRSEVWALCSEAEEAPPPQARRVPGPTRWRRWGPWRG